MESKLKMERFQATLNSLNETQRESVLSDANTLQILAGPGSGKTRVLTCRVAHFVVEKGISPKQIIVVTFTNKAANEMKKRLNALIGEEETSSLLIGTFHAICCRILHIHAKHVDLDPDFAVADTQTSKQIIDKLRDDPQLNLSSFTHKMNVGAIFGIISKAKNCGETSSTYKAKYGSDFKTKDIAILFIRYEAELKKLNMVDFDNLLLKTCELLRKKKDVLNNVKSILVDEYQDTNIVQYELVKLMAQQDNNKVVTVVGDPDQSIYGFRSAEPKNFLKMQNDFSGIGIINMEQNYRSTGKILKAALHVITQDSSRFDKSLRTNNPDGATIFRISTDDEETQAEFVANEIHKVIHDSMGLINYKDIAVLMRMNFISRQFEGVFKRYKIPFTIVGGDRFFDRVEVKDILSYLNFAYNPKDVLSFNRIVNVPKRGIGAATLNKIIKKNEVDGSDLLETIMDIGASRSRSFGAAVKKNLLQFGAVFTTIKAMITKREEVPKIIRYLLDAIQYNDYLKEHYFSDHEARWNNIGELISVARKTPDAADEDVNPISSEKHSDEPQTVSQLSKGGEPESDSIVDFLEYCALCSNQKELDEAEGGKVVLATLHASKGLEWPCVFIATCNDGVIPHSKAQTKSELEEECRLLYVGITRSKFLMYCVSPNKRNSWGRSESQSESHFLNGMDNEIFSTIPPQWDDSIRKMLSETTGKPIPEKNLKRPKEVDSPIENCSFQEQPKKMKLNDCD